MSGSLFWKAALVLLGLLMVSSANGRLYRPAPRRPGPTPATPPTSNPASPRATPQLTVGTPPPPNLFGYPISANPSIAPGVSLGQAAYNSSDQGGSLASIPSSALGFNPYHSTMATGPSQLTTTLSTAGNPYLGSAATLAASAYGGGYGGGSYGGSGYGGGSYGGGGYGGYQDPLGAALQGEARLTMATGTYWKDISQARLTREQANQAALVTEPQTHRVCPLAGEHKIDRSADA